MTVAIRNYAWQLLRTKTDEAADDPDWVGDISQDDPADAITATMPPFAERLHPLTHVEIVLCGVNASRVPQNPASDIDIDLIEEVERDSALLGGTAGDASFWALRSTQANAALATVYAFDMQGASKWTVRLHTDGGSLPGDLQVWYRYASRGE